MAQIRLSLLNENRVAGKPLGRHVEHDSRSRAYAVEPADLSQVQIRPVLWKRWSPILDQGNLLAQGITEPGSPDALGSCTGNAMTGWLGCEPHCTNAQEGARFDERFAIGLYRVATGLDRIPGQYPPDDTGSTGLAVAKAARKAALIRSYGWAFTTLGLVHALQSGPVLVGVPWFEGFDHPDSNGRIAVGGQIRGGHEFVVRGYQPRPGAEGEFLADQSWGPDWADHGSFKFFTGTWEALREQQADVTVPRL